MVARVLDRLSPPTHFTADTLQRRGRPWNPTAHHHLYFAREPERSWRENRPQRHRGTENENEESELERVVVGEVFRTESRVRSEIPPFLLLLCALRSLWLHRAEFRRLLSVSASQRDTLSGECVESRSGEGSVVSREGAQRPQGGEPPKHWKAIMIACVLQAPGAAWNWAFIPGHAPACLPSSAQKHAAPDGACWRSIASWLQTWRS